MQNDKEKDVRVAKRWGQFKEDDFVRVGEHGALGKIASARICDIPSGHAPVFFGGALPVQRNIPIDNLYLLAPGKPPPPSRFDTMSVKELKDIICKLSTLKRNELARLVQPELVLLLSNDPEDRNSMLDFSPLDATPNAAAERRANTDVLRKRIKAVIAARK